MKATGTFDVRLEPQEDDETPAGRMVIHKTYQGDLEGTGSGQMISKRTDDGSAAYAAVEEIEGNLGDRTGGFTLIHRGFMSAERRELEVTILAGSGRGELAGITGSMEITQVDGGHHFTLDYMIPDHDGSRDD